MLSPSPTGVSRLTGSSTRSSSSRTRFSGKPLSFASSASVGSRLNFCASCRRARIRRRTWSATWTGSRIVRPWSASALALLPSRQERAVADRTHVELERILRGLRLGRDRGVVVAVAVLFRLCLGFRLGLLGLLGVVDVGKQLEAPLGDAGLEGKVWERPLLHHVVLIGVPRPSLEPYVNPRPRQTGSPGRSN